MARRAALYISLAGLLAAHLNAMADESAALPSPPSNAALGQTSPVARISDVVQFGMPGDHKFVFCDSGECPDRTLKHISEPPAPVALAMPAPTVATPAVIERADPPPTAPAPKAMHKKRKHARKPVKSPTHDCAVTK